MRHKITANYYKLEAKFNLVREYMVAEQGLKSKSTYFGARLEIQINIPLGLRPYRVQAGWYPAVSFREYTDTLVRCLGARQSGCSTFMACYIVSCRFTFVVSGLRCVSFFKILRSLLYTTFASVFLGWRSNAD